MAEVVDKTQSSYIIKNCTRFIGNNAFKGCSNLTSVIIPNSVTNIGNNAFSGCSSLLSLTIPNSVTSMGSFNFEGLSNLTSVTLPDCVTEIPVRAFNNCKNLTSVNIGNSVTKIGYAAFHNCSKLTSLTLPNSVISIDDQAFEGCGALSSINIPSSVTSIGQYAFNVCRGLTSVHITDLASWCNIDFQNKFSNPLYYAHRLFFNGEEVHDLVIPNTVTTIGQYAFYNCSGLTSITIPNSVTSIGSNALYCYKELLAHTDQGLIVGWYVTKYVSFIEEPFEIGSDVFNLADHATLYVPLGTKEMYEATAGWNNFKRIVEQDIKPTENGEVNYGVDGEVNGDTDLSGTVVGNVFYSIADDAGSYSSTDGCIVVKKPTTDEQVSQVEGTDLFGEQMKDNFTGIIFKIEPGSGTVKVMAETTGDMTLKIKIGDSAPMEFKLNGKMEAKLPYTVEKPTYVYIYAGGSEAAGAKGTRATADSELKIYGISWGDEASGVETIENRDSAKDDAPVYNLNGQHVNTPTKGVYIKNGRKVLVK